MKPTPTTAQTMTAWQLQSLLLSYPDAELTDRFPLIQQAITTLPASLADPLTAFLQHAQSTPLPALAIDYVSTFDHRKRSCLFLTYYAHGDTRNRGVALLKLKQAYARAGLNLTDDELPDHLAVILEFGASGNLDRCLRMLTEYRAGLELLRLALTDDGSPWQHVVTSVSATLPALHGDEREAVARLAAQGPPEEQVGLAPFAPPEYMPQPAGGPR